MANYDRKFHIHTPWEKLWRRPLDVADRDLLTPNPAGKVPFIPGELVQLNASYQFVRGTDDTAPSYFVIDDRGDTGPQMSRKLTVVFTGTFEADTIVFDAALTTVGVALKLGTVNNADVGSVNRAGLIAQGGTDLVIGYVTRVAAANGGLLRFHKTLG
jgi:hypothetical protein